MITTIEAQSAYSLNDSAMQLMKLGEYEKALPITLLAEELGKTEFGLVSRKYLLLKNNVAGAYLGLGKFEVAKKILLEALHTDSIYLNPDETIVERHLNNLSGAYAGLGEYDSIIAIQKLLIQRDSLFGNLESKSFLIHLNNLASSYQDLGDFERASILYNECLHRDSICFGATSQDFIRVLSNLGVLKIKLGKYHEGESLCLKALELELSLEPVNRLSVSRHLSLLGYIYAEMGDFSKAIEFDTAAIGNIERTIGRCNQRIARNLNNIAAVKNSQGKFAESEKILNEVLRIDTLTNTIIHMEHSKHLNTLAGTYYGLGKYDLMKELIQRSKQIDSLTIGPDHPEYATSLNNLGIAFFRNHNFEEAENFYLAACQIDTICLRNSHPEAVQHLLNLSKLYFLTGRDEQAQKILVPAIEIHQKNTIRYLTGLSGRQRIAFWQRAVRSFSYFHSCMFPMMVIQSKIAGIGFECSMLEKAILLRSAIAFSIALGNFESETERSIILEYLETNRQITQLQTSTIPALRTKCANLVLKSEQLEKEIFAGQPSLSNYLQDLKTTWREVQENLATTSVAIEFVNFPYLGGNNISDTIWYGAYILRKLDTLPRFIGLFQMPLLRAALVNSDEKNVCDKEYYDDLYRGVEPASHDSKLSNHLYHLIWLKIDPFLEGITDIYYSNSGLLHNVAFHALPIERRKSLSDKYHLQPLGTTAQLVTGNKPLFASELASSVLLGAMKFELSDSVQKEAAYLATRGQPSVFDEETNFTDAHNRQPWREIYGTKIEVDSIEHLMKNAVIPVSVIKGVFAVEASFKELEHKGETKSPALIHIATHGFSFPEPEKSLSLEGARSASESFRISPDPLLRSGLIFSGANRVWLGGEPIPGVDDGILTAAEIANMDLSDTKLVVLSACQSGLGEIQGTEGVFGLQRAFKLAGVDLILATLWQVPDAETAEFMELFYTAFLKDGLEVRDAFFKAQAEMRERYRDEPFLWGAFVLLE